MSTITYEFEARDPENLNCGDPEEIRAKAVTYSPFCNHVALEFPKMLNDVVFDIKDLKKIVELFEEKK